MALECQTALRLASVLRLVGVLWLSADQEAESVGALGAYFADHGALIFGLQDEQIAAGDDFAGEFDRVGGGLRRWVGGRVARSRNCPPDEG